MHMELVSAIALYAAQYAQADTPQASRLLCPSAFYVHILSHPSATECTSSS